ncbi:uncharacterized protein LOC127260266 [Andrographis paniculata]|uniref:uncharacterized protein LOC127260266 n=1 Tax=Andrographis paniculata TaxID=175694 RepID=UPI0021E99A33|nr:uncharacterized protein LOC127260266 [Andrographis paniculata]
MDCDDLGDKSVPGVGETVLGEGELGNLRGMTIEGEGDEFPNLDDDGKDSDFTVGSGSHGSDDDLFEEFVDMDCDDEGEGDDFLGLDDYYIDQDMANEVVAEEVADWTENDEEDTTEENLIVGSDEEWEELFDSEDEGTVRRRGVSTTFPKFNPLDVYAPRFEIGMIFATRDEVKRAIQSYAISERRSVAFTKIDKRRYARCKEKEPNCEWKSNAVKVKDDTAFQVNLLHPKHSQSCLPSFIVANVKTSWLSEKFAHKFKCDPKREVQGFRKEIMRELNVSVSKDQAYRAKRRALERISEDSVYQYSRLWDYTHELRKSNPGTIVVLGVETDDGESVFNRIYVWYGALKEGFSVGCRPIIGVDGCHLKGIYAGVLLTAVGIDPNNNLFPIAFAVVSRENGETWRWFLTLLKKDLRIGGDKQVTFMSDKQKGLIQAFDGVFLGYDHRFCVRHMDNNFVNAGFRGTALKNAIWRATLASTPGEFRRRMDELKDLDSEAHKWFDDKPVAQWSRSHFKVYSKCTLEEIWVRLRKLGSVDKSCVAELILNQGSRGAVCQILEVMRSFIDAVMRHNPLTYSGSVEPGVLELWVEKMEKIFRVVQVPPDQRANIGAYFLEGRANQW